MVANRTLAIALLSTALLADSVRAQDVPAPAGRLKTAAERRSASLLVWHLAPDGTWNGLLTGAATTRPAGSSCSPTSRALPYRRRTLPERRRASARRGGWKPGFSYEAPGGVQLTASTIVRPGRLL